jgi:putative peptide zinc metalloprotease protein
VSAVAVSTERPFSAERPRLAENVRLVGEFKGSGFAEPQWLIERGGRFVQVTDLLYRLAEQLDGHRTVDEVAERLTATTDWAVTADDVRSLVTVRLAPLGLVESGDSEHVAAAPESSALTVKLRTKTIGPRVIDPLTGVLQYLFAPPMVAIVLALTAIAEVWLYRSHVLVPAFIDALYTPGFLLLAFGLVLVGAAFHELGHASALRYGGGRARAIGAGFYLVFPVFYTDVTDSYRLGRAARVRTGLGGIYFHLIFILALIGVAVTTGQRFLLVAVLLVNLEVVRQFVPFVRLDGYWVLTDLTGIPDFYSQIEPFVRSLLPAGHAGTRLPRLKPWARAVFLGYIVLLIPGLAFLLFLLAKHAPAIAGLLWNAFVAQAQMLAAAVSGGDLVTAATAFMQILLLGISGLGTAYILLGLGLKLVRAPWRQPTRARRVAALAGALAVLTTVAFLWVPH